MFSLILGLIALLVLVRRTVQHAIVLTKFVNNVIQDIINMKEAA